MTEASYQKILFNHAFAVIPLFFSSCSIWWSYDHPPLASSLYKFFLFLFIYLSINLFCLFSITHSLSLTVTLSFSRLFCLSICLSQSCHLFLWSHLFFSFSSLGTVQFLAVGQEIVKSRGFGGLYAGFKFKSLHLGGGGALMAFFLPFFKKIFAIPPSPSSK